MLSWSRNPVYISWPPCGTVTGQVDWPNMGVARQCFNSLAPGRFECDSKNGIFSLVLLIGIFISSHDNALRWMPQDLTDDKSTLVQVMAWCCQATSHYLSQCWPKAMSPYGIIRPQWVNELALGWCMENVIFKLILQIYIMSISWETVPMVVPQEPLRDWFRWWLFVIFKCI